MLSRLIRRRQSHDLHLKIMMLVNPDESWSSKTEIFGYDQQICPGHFPSLVTIREMPFRKDRGRSLAKLEARDEAKKQRTLKNRDEEWNSARWNQSYWTWATSSSSSSWREWSSDETHEQESRDTTWQRHFSWQ